MPPTEVCTMPPSMPFPLGALARASGQFWFTWVAEGRHFAQMRRREGEAVVGVLNRSWLYDPHTQRWLPNYSYPVPA